MMAQDIDEFTERFGPYMVERKRVNIKGDLYWVMKFENPGINTNTFRYYNKDGSAFQMNPDGSQTYIRKNTRKNAVTPRKALLGILVLICLLTRGLHLGIFLILSMLLLLMCLNLTYAVFSAENT